MMESLKPVEGFIEGRRAYWRDHGTRALHSRMSIVAYYGHMHEAWLLRALGAALPGTGAVARMVRSRLVADVMDPGRVTVVAAGKNRFVAKWPDIAMEMCWSKSSGYLMGQGLWVLNYPGCELPTTEPMFRRYCLDQSGAIG
jgi:hypothetical protein